MEGRRAIYNLFALLSSAFVDMRTLAILFSFGLKIYIGSYVVDILNTVLCQPSELLFILQNPIHVPLSI